MRLLIIGSLNGQIGAASQIAMSRGAKVSQVDDIEMALAGSEQRCSEGRIGKVIEYQQENAGHRGDADKDP